MTTVVEHLTRNPSNHTLSRGDVLLKDTEYPWLFSYITWTNTRSFDGNIFSKCLLSNSGGVNLGKSLTLGLSLLVYKMGGINNSSLPGLLWRLDELMCIQQGFVYWTTEMGAVEYGFQSNATMFISECKAAPALLLPLLYFPSHDLPTSILSYPLGFIALCGVTCFTSYIPIFYNYRQFVSGISGMFACV